MAALTERYDALVRWTEEGGGGLHPSVEIYHDDVTKASFRVKAACSVGPDDAIVTLPLSRSLSYLNAISGHPDFAAVAHASIPHAEDKRFFPAGFLKQAPPHVVGRFCLMQEYLLGRESTWWPYIRTLPQPEHMSSMLPLMWPSDDVEFLRGTNAFVAVEEIRSTLKKEHKRAMKLLPPKYQLEYARPLYYWAYCIFTSRSFRPSLILPEADSASLPCEIDDFSVLLPLFDIGNHSPLTRTAWTTDGAAQVCKLQSGKTYSAGEQVFNNYGLKTNAELLLGYGFVFPEAPEFHNDYIHIKTKANPEAGDLAASHIVSLRPLAHSNSVVGRSRLIDPDHLTHCLPCFSHIQDTLIASLYESITKGDDGGADASLTDIMRGKIPEALLEQIVDALGSKLSIDLEALEQFGPEYEAVNRNQELALLYREQCRKVLMNALLSLSATRSSSDRLQGLSLG
ncbi:Uu.00g062330.m01.CDS01 [Anthostomella pinea]|uniref:Uu.00g062330.m01.CDS01 n=1 Tax=Anthostomella pinea TaxID=933095 RepID=A0AAI8YMV6_9PEZI|nr:Uu.00g062330.m01.CDS01 [Anthostomella pinea]